MTLTPGFIGSANFGGTFRCTDFSVNLKQTPLFYDHIIGLRDSTPTNITDVKSDTGQRNEQKKIWRPSVIIVDGGLNFPWTDQTLGKLWQEARTGSSFSLDFTYNCGLSRQFTGCKVNSYTIKATAGELVTTDLSIMGINMTTLTQQTAPLNPNTQKIVTWDAFDAGLGDLAYFECTVNNNCIPIYTNGSLNPYEIRVGMQLVTGTVGYYQSNTNINMVNTSAPSTFTLNIDTWSQKFNIIYHPQQQNAALGAIITPIQFTGVDDALPS